MYQTLESVRMRLLVWAIVRGSGELTLWWQVIWDILDKEIHKRNILPKRKKDKLYIKELKIAAIVANFYAASAAIENKHIV